MNDQRGKPRRKTTRQSPKTATRKTTSRLKRRVNRMPAFVRQSLTERGLTRAYRSRPAYQRNDYIGWITSAKGEATQRVAPESDTRELAGGRTYRKMKWSGPRAQTASGSR
jgi:hypothetical protein